MIRLTLVALTFLAAPSAAQTATFTGVLEALPAPSTCTGATHAISHNGTLVMSSTLGLDAFVGTPMEFTAKSAGLSCPLWDLTSATPASSTLTVCGTPALGAPMRFRVEPSGVMGQWAIWWSATPQFAPMDPALGTLMLAAPFNFLAAGLSVGPAPYFETNMPSVPALIGTTIYAQGARMDIGPVSPWELTNPRSFTIAPFTPKYILPNC